MRKRDIQINFRLSRKEADMLMKRVQKSGLTREGYFRHIINNLAETDAPFPDHLALKQRLNPIGRALNQIARDGHMHKTIDAEKYDEAIIALDKVMAEIISAFGLRRARQEFLLMERVNR